jgi:geranylgeranyl pyrophosphate synthase
MKPSVLEEVTAAMEAHTNFGHNQQINRYENSQNDESVRPIPDQRYLTELIGFDAAPAVTNILADVLMRPIAGLASNPGKRIRAQLVSFSYRLLAGDRPLSYAATKRHRSCAEAIELLHAGSLIVDDIEDGSTVRRGRPALHRVYGMPIALNAGNWLYFWPAALLKQSGLSEDDLLLVYEHYHSTLLRAHFGQALDLGTRVDTLAQDAVTEVCLASMRLKTGALMGFATLLGAALADASEQLLSSIEQFGRDLGVALQMFDDLGNAIGKCEPAKRYEDITLLRPSWLWACAAQSSSPADYRNFVAAARKLPDAAELECWMERHELVRRTRRSARAHLDLSFEVLRNRLTADHVRWSPEVLEELYALGEEIAVAYG